MVEYHLSYSHGKRADGPAGPKHCNIELHQYIIIYIYRCLPIHEYNIYVICTYIIIYRRYTAHPWMVPTCLSDLNAFLTAVVQYNIKIINMRGPEGLTGFRDDNMMERELII